MRPGLRALFTNGNPFVFFRVVYALNKRKSQDDKLGTSKVIAKANKQLTKTCIVVTCIFLITLGESFLSVF